MKKKQSAEQTEQRYTICGDDSGHEYFVKIQDVNAFYQWVASFEEMSGEEEDPSPYKGPDFEANRIDGHFTFTDPRCE